MDTKKCIKKIVAVVAIGLMAFGGLAGCTTMQYGGYVVKDQNDLDSVMGRMTKESYDDGYSNGAKSVDITVDNKEILKGMYTQEELDNATAKAESEQKARDDQVLADYKEAEEAQAAADLEAVAVELSKFEFEDLLINGFIVADLSDRDLDQLQDSEIEFDGDEYDIEEVLSFDNVALEVNGNDYNGDSFVTIPVEGISYSYDIDTVFDTSLIDEDDTLEIKLLGQDVEIIDWSTDEVTFNSGVKETLYEGESVKYEEKTVTVKLVGEDACQIDVDGEAEIIELGESKEINGVEVIVYELLYTEKTKSVVVLKLGEQVSYTIEDGDEFEKDSVWEYVIDANSIGIKLVEEFDEIDEDEEYKALAVGDSLSLPYGFATVEYIGLTVEDTEEYSFDMTEKSGTDYARVKGDFRVGINDYEKVYIDNTGEIFDEVLNSLGTSVDLADTDLTMDTSTGDIVIDDITVPVDLTAVDVDGADISTFDEKFTTDYGIEIDNPEDNIEDNEVELTIPDEQIEGIVRVY